MTPDQATLLRELGHDGCSCTDPRGYFCPLEVARRAGPLLPRELLDSIPEDDDALDRELDRICDELDEDEKMQRRPR